MSENDRVDRRVRRTREAVQQALIQLMMERDYSAITVQDVVDRADISRSTFYLHYADKDDVLRQGAVNVRGWVASLAPRDRRFGFSEPLYQHCCDMRPVFRAITERQSWAVMHELFVQILGELIRAELSDVDDAATLDALVQLVSAAFLAVLTWSMDRPGDGNPLEMDRLFRTFALPGVDAILGVRARSAP